MSRFSRNAARTFVFAVVISSLSGTAFADDEDASPPRSCHATPEIDPGSAAGALTLLAGGLLTLKDRRRPA
ncbi:MAG: hypothetical protein NVSMB9_32630 [Isosphaeraceae bacterium]